MGEVPRCQNAKMPASELTSAEERSRQARCCLCVAAPSAILSVVLLSEARAAVVAACALAGFWPRVGLVPLGPLAAVGALVPAATLMGRRPALGCGVFAVAAALLALAVGSWFAPSEGLLEDEARWLGAFFAICLLVGAGSALLDILEP